MSLFGKNLFMSFEFILWEPNFNLYIFVFSWRSKLIFGMPWFCYDRGDSYISFFKIWQFENFQIL